MRAKGPAASQVTQAIERELEDWSGFTWTYDRQTKHWTVVLVPDNGGAIARVSFGHGSKSTAQMVAWLRKNLRRIGAQRNEEKRAC
jgi:hypothetical protein